MNSRKKDQDKGIRSKKKKFFSSNKIFILNLAEYLFGEKKIQNYNLPGYKLCKINAFNVYVFFNFWQNDVYE
jgi:hypothetical protein